MVCSRCLGPMIALALMHKIQVNAVFASIFVWAPGCGFTHGLSILWVASHPFFELSRLLPILKNVEATPFFFLEEDTHTESLMLGPLMAAQQQQQILSFLGSQQGAAQEETNP